MVATIGNPVEDSVIVFKEILSSRKRHKEFYTRIKDDWNKQISSYIKYEADPTKIFPLKMTCYTTSEEEAEKRKNTLINLYSPKNSSKLHSIFEQMRNNHDLLLCPCCGDAGEPDTLDHYLPKDKFPELSILLVNLTPMCSKCQRIKGTKYLTKSGNKKYIHPYYDEINVPLYYVNFKAPYNVPVFKLKINEDIDDDLASLAKKHAVGIDLKNRLNKFCRKKYVHLIKMAKRARTKKSNNLIPVLEFRLEQEEEEKAINCWEAIFYRSVLADDALLDYLINQELLKSFK